MYQQIAQVEEFHKAFQLTINSDPIAIIPPKEADMRHRIMKEENNEYLDACRRNDIVGILDAIGDMAYVLCGTAITHGISPELLTKAITEIHRSNMSKLDENGNPVFREDGKVLKGNSYFRPDLEKLINIEKIK